MINLKNVYVVKRETEMENKEGEKMWNKLTELIKFPKLLLLV